MDTRCWWYQPRHAEANALMSRWGVRPQAKTSGIDGGPHKHGAWGLIRRNAEEPYQGLT